MEIDRSLFVLLPKLPLRLWLGEIEPGEELIELGRDREADEFTVWYNEVPVDLAGALALEIDLLLRAAAIFSLSWSGRIVDGVADKASLPAWTGTCLYGTLGFSCT